MDVLAKLKIQDGMDLCVDIMNGRRWGRDIINGAGKDQPEALETLVEDMPAADGLRSRKDFIANPTASLEP